MVPTRTRFFCVDPEDAILSTLRGSGNAAQISAAWELMRKRLELGREFLNKYVKEFKNPDYIEDFSPASTSKELTDELTANCSTEGANENFPVWDVFQRIPQISVSSSWIWMKLC
jgi:hypothetical protein